MKTLDLLDRSLRDTGRHMLGATIQQKLLASAARDIEELLPQLEPRAEELATIAKQKLRQRGEREERDLRDILERQHQRVAEELAKHEGKLEQLTLDYGEEDRRQLQDNIRWWHTRLAQFTRDLEREPQRIREFYQVKAQRIEPVGLVYLWPETN